MAEEREGWAFPGNATRAHYFVDSMSLCRRWGFYQGPLERDTGPSRQDCTTCRRALDQRASREGEPS